MRPNLPHGHDPVRAGRKQCHHILIGDGPAPIGQVRLAIVAPEPLAGGGEPLCAEKALLGTFHRRPEDHDAPLAIGKTIKKIGSDG